MPKTLVAILIIVTAILIWTMMEFAVTIGFREGLNCAKYVNAHQNEPLPTYRMCRKG